MLFYRWFFIRGSSRFSGYLFYLRILCVLYAYVVAGKPAAAPDKKPSVKQQKGLPKVTLLYTGGTIGSKLDYVSGGVKALTKAEELLAEVPELSGIVELDVKQIMSVFSEDMTHAEWKKIAEEVAEAVNKGSKGVIITL